MRPIKLVVAYDGSPFVGWQRQANGTSIQGVIEAALTRLSGAPVSVVGAGRTDAGVHALAQVASARIAGAMPLDQVRRGLNALLPPEVRIVALDAAAEGFHARFGSRTKRYAYRLVNAPVLSPFERQYAWHVTHALDRTAMARALEALVGTHDFAAFQAAGSGVRETTRTILDATLVAGPAGLTSWAPASGPGAASDPTALTVTVCGNGFLRHMVRTIVGTLVEIGRGRWPASHAAEVLASRDRRLAGPTAPPHGLFLVDVEYDVEGPSS